MSIIDPRLRFALPDMWPSRVTIQSVRTTRSASNQIVVGSGVDVPSMKELECSLGPFIESRPTDEEQRKAGIREIVNRRILKLNGYFPDIKEHPDNQAVVDGVVYEIWGVEADSRRFSTRLRLTQVNP